MSKPNTAVVGGKTITWRVVKTATTFLIKYQVDGGPWLNKRVPSDIKAKAVAETYAKAFVEARGQEMSAASALPVAVKRQVLTVRQLATKWLAQREASKLAPSTVADNRSHLDSRILPAMGEEPSIGDMPADEVTPGTIRQRVRGLVEAGLSGNYIRNVVATLRNLFEDAMADDWVDLPTNPVAHPAVSRAMPAAVTKAGRNTIIHLSRAEAERLLTAPKVEVDRRVRYLLALTSGLRDGEIAGLTFGDLFLEEPVPYLRVNKALAIKSKKKGPALRAPKTEDSVRKVPLHPLAIQSLKAWKAQGWHDFVRPARRPGLADPVLPNAFGQAVRPPSASILRTDLGHAKCSSKYAGEHPFTFHALRRSFSTWLAEAGVPAEVREKLMGQRPRSVAGAHYTAFSLATLAEAVAKITLDLSPAQVVAPLTEEVRP